MATTRLYSFQFPSDSRTALEPWRSKLGSEFDAVVAMLDGRDRAVEDHLNLGMSQGRLAYAINATFTTFTTEADVTGLSVTVSVPPNRVLRVTGQAIMSLSTTGTGIGWISQDGAHVAAFGEIQQFIGGPGTLEFIQSGSGIVTPSAGAHTYKLTAERTAGVATFQVGGVATAPAFILVEDIGPVLQ